MNTLIPISIILIFCNLIFTSNFAIKTNVCKLTNNSLFLFQSIPCINLLFFILLSPHNNWQICLFLSISHILKYKYESPLLKYFLSFGDHLRQITWFFSFLSLYSPPIWLEYDKVYKVLITFLFFKSHILIVLSNDAVAKIFFINGFNFKSNIVWECAESIEKEKSLFIKLYKNKFPWISLNKIWLLSALTQELIDKLPILFIRL